MWPKFLIIDNINTYIVVYTFANTITHLNIWSLFIQYKFVLQNLLKFLVTQWDLDLMILKDNWLITPSLTLYTYHKFFAAF